MTDDLSERINKLFTPQGLMTYTRIYMIEQKIMKLEEDDELLEEFKTFLEEDRHFRKGGGYNEMEYFGFRTQPIYFYGVYKTVYFLFTNKELIGSKWDTQEIQPPFGGEIRNEITNFYKSSILDKENGGSGKRVLR